MTIAVTEVQGPLECNAALLRRKGELIVGLEVSEGVATIFAEHDDEPASLRGSVVSGARSPCSLCSTPTFRPGETS